MKITGAIGTAILSLTLGASALAYPQQEQHDQQEEKDKPAQEKEKKAQPDKPVKQEEKSAQQPEKMAKPQENNGRQPAQHAKAGRIPDERFKASFGRDHRFRVSQADYQGRRFQYGGYWFGFVDPWPSNWLYTQDVYVVDIGGVYYLCNASYPGVNLAISVTL
jgi:hypothetical protein